MLFLVELALFLDHADQQGVKLTNMNHLSQVSINQHFKSPWGKDGFGFGKFASVILSNAVVIAAVILFLLLLFGGVMIIHGSSQNDPKAAAAGKQAATSAVIGFILVFAAYWIIQIIEVVTGVNILSPGI
jgi:hypothetical protein